jgi:hypothetical protein
MMLQFAAFGAFVPWTPLQLLQVPRIRPGGSTLVSTEVIICEDGTLLAEDGGAYSEDRKRYQDALRTIQNDEQLKTMSVWQVVARKVRNQLAENRVKRLRAQRETARKAQERASENRGLWLGDTSLAEFEELFDLEPADRPRADLHQGRSVYWIGNINVLMGGIDVERHEARAFRIYPGKINRSWFFLGGPPRCSTSFEILGAGEGWSTRLYETKPDSSWSFRDHADLRRFCQGLEMETYPGEMIEPGKWARLGVCPMIAVEICPPPDATSSALAIQVLQRSPCGEEVRKAVVEFDFSESAVGPGCHTV